MVEKKALIKTQEKAVVKWKGEQITVSFHDVKTLICPYATDQETAVFLKTCQSLNLNPFAGEIYLIKYSEGDKAATVIAIDSYLKAGETNQNYDGHEAGVVLKDSIGKLEFREGSLILDGEYDRLVGGFAKVYRKDRTHSFYMAVNKAECIKYTKGGNLTKFWTKDKQPMMLRKTALKRALVEAFPSLFAGTMSTAEVAEEPEAEYHEISEGELPPAYERNGEAYWAKWWARQKEKGLSEDDVHSFLGVASIKEDWLEQGRTLEEAEEIINEALEQRAKPKKAAPPSESATSTKVKPKQADWRAFWEHAEQLGISRENVHSMLGVTSVAEWIDQGKTLEEAIGVLSKRLTSEAEANKEEEGFNIDMAWLKEALDKIKWNEAIAWSFVVSHYKVDGSGTFAQTLERLTREQAEEFVSEINSRVEKQVSLL